MLQQTLIGQAYISVFRFGINWYIFFFDLVYVSLRNLATLPSLAMYDMTFIVVRIYSGWAFAGRHEGALVYLDFE